MRPSLVEENSRKENLRSKFPAIKNGNAANMIEMRHHLTVLKETIRLDKTKQDATSSTIEVVSREARKTTGHLRKTIQPMKLPTAVEQQAKNETSFLLGDSGVPSLDIKNFDAFNPLLKNIDRDAPLADDLLEEGIDINFNDGDVRKNERERAREYDAQANQSRLRGFNEEDQNTLIRTLGIDPGSKEGALIKECIPCGFRPLSLDDIEFSNPFADTIEDLKEKLKELERLLGALFLGNQFEEDLCDLLKLWDAQCIPDLFGVISLLGILFTKYTDGLTNTWRNALNSLIAPLLSPVIGPFVHNLERYVDMIVDPLTCVVEALESQMYKLDIVGAANKVQAHKRAFNRQKINFYTDKINALERRKVEIQEDTVTAALEGDFFRGELETTPLEKLDTTRPATAKTDVFPRYKSNKPFVGPTNDPDYVIGPNAEKQFNSRRLEGGSLFNTSAEFDTPLPPPDGLRLSYAEELSNIQKDIDQAKVKKQQLGAANSNINDSDSKAFGDVSGGRRTLLETRDSIEQKGRALKSIIYQVTFGINQGIQVVRDTLEMYREELERTITGRVQNQQDQIELARNLQQIQRWISIVNTLIKLKNNGFNLKEMCNGDNNNQAMGAFVGAFKSEPAGENFNFYSGTDNNGNDLMVIAPGGAVLDVTSVEYEDIGEDELLGDVQLDDVQKTVTFNNLNEADELNRKGVMLDLGNIEGKDINIRLDDATSEKTDLDLRAQDSYVIIKNDFCSKSPIKGSPTTIRQWADNL